MKEIKRLIRCSNGHFFDGGKYDVCPHCSNTRVPDVTVFVGEKVKIIKEQPAAVIKEEEAPAEIKEEIIAVNNKTEEKYEEICEDALREKSDEKAISDFVADMMAKGAENETVHYFEKSIGSEPVVGWLVCIRGVHFGEDFKIKSGRNFIGRSGSMNISLSGDKTVSRDRHAILTYDPKSNSFLIQPGDSSELCYLNDEPVLIPAKLKMNDRITLGESELIFIPFCSDSFSWEKKNNN